MNTRPPNNGDMIEIVSTQIEPVIALETETAPPAIVHIMCCDENAKTDEALCGEDMRGARWCDTDESSCLMCVIAFRRGNCPAHVTCLFPIFGKGQVGGRQ